jgi:hypothetical protein
MKVNGVPASTEGVRLTAERLVLGGNVVRAFAKRVTQ